MSGLVSRLAWHSPEAVSPCSGRHPGKSPRGRGGHASTPAVPYRADIVPGSGLLVFQRVVEPFAYRPPGSVNDTDAPHLVVRNLSLCSLWLRRQHWARERPARSGLYPMPTSRKPAAFPQIHPVQGDSFVARGPRPDAVVSTGDRIADGGTPSASGPALGPTSCGSKRRFAGRMACRHAGGRTRRGTGRSDNPL